MNISHNIENILEEIPKDVRLVAVSKTKTIEEMDEAYNVGIRDFGENKVQELIKKEEVFHNDVRWHQIGVLQTNKVKYLVGKVFLIHSLSSIKLLHQIEKEFGKSNLTANVLIQINIGKDENKSGFYEEEVENLVLEIEKCKYVKVKGLMCVVPKGNDDSNRMYFRQTKNLFEHLRKQKLKNVTMEILSMGMTHDYKIAIEEGSNLVRIGEGIFGKRNYDLGGLKNE